MRSLPSVQPLNPKPGTSPTVQLHQSDSSTTATEETLDAKVFEPHRKFGPLPLRVGSVQLVSLTRLFLQIGGPFVGVPMTSALLLGSILGPLIFFEISIWKCLDVIVDTMPNCAPASIRFW